MLGFAAALAILVAGAGAQAGPTSIGAVTEIQSGMLPSPITLGGYAVEIGEATGSYAVPAGYGTITSWSHQTGTASGTLTFKVYRPASGVHQFTVIAADTENVTANILQTFPVQIPVHPGDRIGLSSDTVQLAFETDNPSDLIGFFGADPAVRSTDSTDGDPFNGFKLDVSATLQPSPTSPPGSPGSAPTAPSPTPAPQPGGPVPVPAVTRLAIAPRAFAAASSRTSAEAARRRAAGAIVSYRVNVAAKVRFAVVKGGARGSSCSRRTGHHRKHTSCPRTALGTFTQTAKAGVNRFRFTGHVGGAKLAPGAYTIQATPTAGGRSGKRAIATFRIIR